MAPRVGGACHAGSMCGRYASFVLAQDLEDAFQIDVTSPVAAGIPASWNVAPTSPVRVVYETAVDGTILRLLDAALWGLVPGWAKDRSMASRMINARIETLAEKPSFRGPLAYSRCLVPMEGYYEWQTVEGGRKQPHYVTSRDGTPLLAAGLTSLWQGELLTCTIVTRAARAGLRHIHDREPVFLTDPAPWLNPGLRDRHEARRLLDVPSPELAAQPVGTAVNSVRNDSPHLVASPISL